jgi:cytidylate kinase
MYKHNAIILSGPPISGKSVLGELLAKKYNFEFYSVGLMWRKRWAALYPKKEVPFEVFWKKSQISLTDQEKKSIDDFVRQLCKKGNVIADSRFAAICGDTIGLKVLVTASFEVRFSRALDREIYRFETSKRLKRILKSRENDEVALGKNLYQLDYRNPQSYHVVLNSGLLTLDEEIDIVHNLVINKK